MKRLLVVLFIFCFIKSTSGQTWVMKENILKFPTGFESWLKKHNGGVTVKEGRLGSNQGIEAYDFNKDGKQDLIIQIFPSNDVTREYIRGIFLQDSKGYFNLDTNYVIKGKGDMWYGGCGDFNGDGLTDYHYITTNFHGADSTRKYSPEMVYDHWPERVLINNGKSFDTLSLDQQNIRVLSSYVADVNGDGKDDIVTTSRENLFPVAIYSYNSTTKKFDKIKPDITQVWQQKFASNPNSYPIFNIGNFNSSSEFASVYFDKQIAAVATPYAYESYNFTIFNINNLSFKQTDWERKERTISKIISQSDQDDVYKFSLHEIPSIYKIDIDNDNKYEYLAAGFYQNDYSIKTQRYAYGLQVFNELGKEVTDSYLSSGGYDDNVDLNFFSLDIDRDNPGNEFIPGAWGVRAGDISYFYVKKDNKIKKQLINIVDINGKQIPDSKLTAKALTTFPNPSGINGILLYDFHDLKSASLIIQEDCSKATATITASGSSTFCQGGKVTLTATEGSSYLWSTGATTRSIEVSTGGNYSVRVTNANGCSATSTATTVTVSSFPTATITAGGPTTITQTGNVVLSANTGTGFTYQWLRDGIAINAATARTYTATSGGSYTVKVINATGCETLSSAMVVKTVFVLPANNYQLNVQGETCRTSDNGRVNITAVQNLSYTATISRAGQTVRSINFSSNGELTGLSAGSYTLCITVAGQSEYKQCYDVTITEPQDLSVYSEVNLVTNTVELSMSGSYSYTISLNGKNYTSNSPRMSLALSSGLNKIIVQAAQACQGVYTEEIYVDERVELYPNPFTGTLNIKIENQENKELNIKVLNGSGTIVYQAKQRVNNHLISLDLSQLESGYYFVVIGKQTYKVIKK